MEPGTWVTWEPLCNRQTRNLQPSKCAQPDSATLRYRQQLQVALQVAWLKHMVISKHTACRLHKCQKQTHNAGTLAQTHEECLAGGGQQDRDKSWAPWPDVRWLSLKIQADLEGGLLFSRFSAYFWFIQLGRTSLVVEHHRQIPGITYLKNPLVATWW